LRNSFTNLDEFAAKYEYEINDLKDKIGNKASIPKNLVYPKFEILSNFYIDLLEEKILHEQRIQQFQYLKKIFYENKYSMNDKLLKDTKNIVSTINEHNDLKILNNMFSNDITRIESNSNEYYNGYVDLQGICPVSLVDMNGVVLEGNPEYGLYKFRNQTYIFNNIQNIVKFYNKPE